ncbi:hypothetical protein PR202_gb25567 [Eleusine coracana subsp. coracana]|uniref:Transposase Tnp1/En/Spm-like domain-containing protein n=1 Tax=Eleusine coracana subsp. coracana TaxID=191504 RepID=A0AAV5FLV2_ELECO|nr:hypothetical protein PR202_gb25567 [Eleusine coracana subsp. coracana]
MESLIMKKRGRRMMVEVGEKRKAAEVVDHSIERSEPAIGRNLRSSSCATSAHVELPATVSEQQQNEVSHHGQQNKKARSLRAKANHAKLTQNHTSGSKSHARVEKELREELGCFPHRDEVFIKSHTHKTEQPEKGSEVTIVFVDHPELTEKSIQEGNVYFHVCGREKNGYVRVVGLGPTPAGLDMPGAKKYTSTKLQMKIEAHRQADKKVEALESRVDSMQQQMDILMQKLQEFDITLVGSNYEQNSRTRPICDNEEREGHEDRVASNSEDDVVEEHLSDYEVMFSNRHVVQQQEQHEEGGRDVILNSIMRSYDVPVAKATIQTTNPNAIVAGTHLGVEFSEVVVNHYSPNFKISFGSLDFIVGDNGALGLENHRSDLAAVVSMAQSPSLSGMIPALVPLGPEAEGTSFGKDSESDRSFNEDSVGSAYPYPHTVNVVDIADPADGNQDGDQDGEQEGNPVDGHPNQLAEGGQQEENPLIDDFSVSHRR